MRFFLLAFIALLLTSCHQQKKTTFITDEKIQKELQEKFILVEDGGTIELPEGNFLLSKALSIEGKNNITIKGKGKDKTILSFKDQKDGAEGGGHLHYSEGRMACGIHAVR